MPAAPVVGSGIVCVVDQDGTPIRIVADNSFTPPRLVVELPASALRDLGIVTVDGAVKITDGTDEATVRDVTGAKALDVSVVDAAGAQITSFGGGTQYADGAARGTATGTLAMVDDGTNIQSAAGDTSGRQVMVGAAADGAAAAGNPVRIGAKDSSGNTQDIVSTALGILTVAQGSYTPADGLANASNRISSFDSGGVDRPIDIFPWVFNGTTWDRARGDTAGGFVQGNVAHDVGNAGNPIQMGGHAVAGGASPTSVTAADRVRAIFNQHGIPYVIGGHPNLITREYDFGAAAQTDVNLAAALVAVDERIYVTRFEALCDNANTVAVSVRAGFGTASVPTASATGVSGMIATHPGIAAGSGVMCGSGGGIIAVGGLGEEPRLTSSAATSGNLHVLITYFLIDETP